MKPVGIFLILVGIAWGLIAMDMKTSVVVRRGGFSDSFYIPPVEAHNLSLANRRLNHLIGASVALISGVLLFGFGSINSQHSDHEATEKISPEYKKCLFCAELIKGDSKICRFCGKEAFQASSVSMTLAPSVGSSSKSKRAHSTVSNIGIQQGLFPSASITPHKVQVVKGSLLSSSKSYEHQAEIKSPKPEDSNDENV